MYYMYAWDSIGGRWGYSCETGTIIMDDLGMYIVYITYTYVYV